MKWRCHFWDVILSSKTAIRWGKKKFNQSLFLQLYLLMRFFRTRSFVFTSGFLFRDALICSSLGPDATIQAGRFRFADIIKQFSIYTNKLPANELIINTHARAHTHRSTWFPVSWLPCFNSQRARHKSSQLTPWGDSCVFHDVQM